MDTDALLKRLMKTFLGEFREHVQALERDLLALERGSDPSARTETFDGLFRTAHTLKGAARSVNIDVIEAASHCLEAIFAAARDGPHGLGPELFELLFSTVDALKDTSRRLTVGEGAGGGPLAAILPRLEDAHGRAAAPPQARLEPTRPTAAKKERPPPSQALRAPEDAAAEPATAGSVRVSSAKLDRMLALGGELLVARRRAEGRDADLARLLDRARRWEAERRTFERAIGGAQRRNPLAEANAPWVSALERNKENLQWMTRQIDQLAAGLAADRRALDQVAAPLEAELLRVRMVPFAEACEGFERSVRDLAKSSGKEVRLTVDGGDIAFDRSILEAIKGSLLHLVRNAVDHGIERPAERIAAGKPAEGRIALSAALRNGRVEVVVADDGRGFDRDAIREQARKRALPEPKDDSEIARAVFARGFSTAAMVTTLSGRGIGLDVVKTDVESNRGSVGVQFERGRGTRFVLTMPLTLTRLRALLVADSGQCYAFDSADIRSLLRVGEAELRTIEGRDVLTLDGAPVPIFSLAETLGQPRHEPPRAGLRMPVVVLAAGSERAAFAVDELLAEQEMVIKDLGPRLRRVPNVTGATVLETGRIALILNAAELVRAALGHTPSRAISAAFTAGPVEAKTRLLIAEDSVTTRTLVKSILEAAGYEVTATADGMEAWQVLQEKGADLVVSDVEMPRMDGFALTEAIRASKRFRNLPVILVTAMERERDKVRGMEAGADAYLLKSAFDQTDLIQTIGQIL
jgi:two-component system chemotaxis sensor kinase CheA